MPRTSSKSTHPHNNTRLTNRPNRAKLSAPLRLALDSLSLLVALRKTLIERTYATPHQNTTSGHHVKAIAYIKRESKRFHKPANDRQRDRAEISSGAVSIEMRRVFLRRESYEIGELVNLPADAGKCLLKQPAGGVINQRVIDGRTLSSPRDYP